MTALSHAIQDYLKGIYKIRQGQGTVTLTAVAKRMGVSAASATNMVKRLARLGLVAHAPYRTVELTAAGEKAALEIIRHHRLLELFLRQHLGLDLHQIHREAEKMEHTLSEAVEARIAALLGDPVADPHGDPIPGPGGMLTQQAHPRLEELRPGDRGEVARVSDEDPRLLRRLSALGLLPGTHVRVLQRHRNGVLALLSGGRRRHVSPALARAVFVARHRS